VSAKYVAALVAGMALVAGLVFVTHWQREEPSAPPVVPAPALPAAPEASAAPPRGSATPSSTPVDRVAADQPARFASTHEAQFKEATDYLEFALAMLPRARAGDFDAQFHLYAALDYCRRGYRNYFDTGQKRRSLEEAVDEAANRPPGDAREIPKVHSRCRKLMESDIDELGEPQQWLQLAASGKHPRAQAKLAGQLASRSQRLSGVAAARAQADARALVRESLASRDPAAIWEMGALTSLRADAAGGNDADAMAFAQAACDRGLDCSAGSEAAAQWCRLVPDCQPFESVQDLLLRSSANPAALADRARRINELIDAGDWQALGFADPTPAR
jgi:hypothetical protein